MPAADQHHYREPGCEAAVLDAAVAGTAAYQIAALRKHALAAYIITVGTGTPR